MALALVLAGTGLAESTSAVVRAMAPQARFAEPLLEHTRELGAPQEHVPRPAEPRVAPAAPARLDSLSRPLSMGTTGAGTTNQIPQEAAPSPQAASPVTSFGARSLQAASGSSIPVPATQVQPDSGAGTPSMPAKLGSTLTLTGSIDKQAPTSAWTGQEGLFFYTVTVPGGASGTQTGYKERFMLFAPAQNKPRPMLVVFHKFSTTERDAWVNTQFFQEAWARGWYIVAPLSASGVNFGAPLTQTNTEVVLEWMTTNFNVRPDRIYGVGFSMGGGVALSYAARHLDPTKPMFAGIVNHTGGIALSNTYINEPASQFILDFWFGNGAPGSASAWKMSVASMLDFDPGTLVVDPTTDMARNLENMPVKIFRVVDEPLGYLTQQSQVLATHLMNQGTQTKVEVVSGNTHEWGNLSESKTINWLSLKRLTLPLSGRILADRSATYYYFSATQTAIEVFSSFDFDLDLVGNTLTVTAAANLACLEVETLEAGLDPLSTLRVDMETADGSAVEYVLRDFMAAPTSVTRDAIASVAWVHDALAETLTLQETDGGNHLWEITP